jgi:hypothetical protein
VTNSHIIALQDRLLDAAAKGLTHLSVWPTHSTDGKTTYWTCRATPSNEFSYVEATHTSIDIAIMDCLIAMKAAKKRKKEVTATVKFEPEGQLLDDLDHMPSNKKKRAKPRRDDDPVPTVPDDVDANVRDQADPAADWMIKT